MEANTRITRLVELIAAIAGIVLIAITSMCIISKEIIRRAGIYITYYLGDIISRTTMNWGIGYGVYKRLMLWSSNLDIDDILWKTPCEEHPEVEQANNHQRRK